MGNMIFSYEDTTHDPEQTRLKFKLNRQIRDNMLLLKPVERQTDEPVRQIKIRKYRRRKRKK